MFPVHDYSLAAVLLPKVTYCFTEKQGGWLDSQHSSGLFCETHCQPQDNTAERHPFTHTCIRVLQCPPVPLCPLLGSGCSQHGHDGHPRARPAWAAQRTNTGGRGWGGGGGEGACVSWGRGEGAGRGGRGGGKGRAAVSHSGTSGSFGSDPNQPTPLLVPSSCVPPISFTLGVHLRCCEHVYVCVCACERASVYNVRETLSIWVSALYFLKAVVPTRHLRLRCLLYI